MANCSQSLLADSDSVWLCASLARLVCRQMTWQTTVLTFVWPRGTSDHFLLACGFTMSCRVRAHCDAAEGGGFHPVLLAPLTYPARSAMLGIGVYHEQWVRLHICYCKRITYPEVLLLVRYLL